MTTQLIGLLLSICVMISTAAEDVTEDRSDGDNEAFRQSSEFLNSASSFMETLETVKISEEDDGISRGAKLMRMAIPLIIGFKIASLITASIGVLKAFVVKTVVVSGLSLFVSLGLAAKFILDRLARSSRNSEHSFYYSHPYSSPSEPIPAWEHPAFANPSPVQNELRGQWSQPTVESNNNLSNSPTPVAAAQRKTILKPNAYKISMYKKTVKEVSKK